MYECKCRCRAISVVDFNENPCQHFILSFNWFPASSWNLWIYTHKTKTKRTIEIIFAGCHQSLIIRNETIPNAAYSIYINASSNGFRYGQAVAHFYQSQTYSNTIWSYYYIYSKWKSHLISGPFSGYSVLAYCVCFFSSSLLGAFFCLCSYNFPFIHIVDEFSIQLQFFWWFFDRWDLCPFLNRKYELSQCKGTWWFNYNSS